MNLSAAGMCLEANFERPEDLVKFIRYDHASRHRSVSGRKLYRAIQAEVGGRAGAAKKYVESLVSAQEAYLAKGGFHLGFATK